MADAEASAGGGGGGADTDLIGQDEKRAVLEEETDGAGMTALHHCCLSGRPLTAERLVAAFGKGLMDALDDEGRTPVVCAKEAGHGGLAADLTMAAAASASMP